MCAVPGQGGWNDHDFALVEDLQWREPEEDDILEGFGCRRMERGVGDARFDVVPLDELERRVFVMEDPAASSEVPGRYLRLNAFKWDRAERDNGGPDEVTLEDAGLAG